MSFMFQKLWNNIKTNHWFLGETGTSDLLLCIVNCWRECAVDEDK